MECIVLGEKWTIGGNIKFGRFHIWKKKNKKRKFKESNISVTESLTSLKMIKLKDGRYKYGFNKIWISNGRIMVMKEESIKPDGYGWLKKQLFFYTLCYRKEFCWAFHLPYFGAITIRHIWLLKGENITMLLVCFLIKVNKRQSTFRKNTY